ncbi:alpha/beta-hydrolase [Testicularia cyperi]|uniref:Alpha/beta-hydrolase n=1 Tax=Testicularia cyperi TaxID=1882483 RepID=A0A317XGI4_9BASI|nr:alpha/beta-hydrolase [Testicularia cyperi]
MTTPEPVTFVYKTFTNVDGEETSIPVDVYLPATEGSEPITPVIWVHTGGFLQGTRKFVPPHFLRALERHKLALIAPDFRLCPQVTIREVLVDVVDCVRWTLDETARASSGLKSTQLSTSRYILGGSSAGGWPALLLGLGLHDLAITLPQPPIAVFSIYAITTVTRDLAPFFYETQKPLAWAVDGKPIKREPLEEEGHMQKCLDDKHNLIKASSPTSVKIRTEAPPASNPVRAALYNFARQEACFPDLILADPAEAPSVCTPTLIRTKMRVRTSTSHVPVLICYGDSDPKVPHSQSVHVVEALKSVGYTGDDLLVLEEKGADHLFDMEPKSEIEGMWEWVASKI